MYSYSCSFTLVSNNEGCRPLLTRNPLRSCKFANHEITCCEINFFLSFSSMVCRPRSSSWPVHNQRSMSDTYPTLILLKFRCSTPLSYWFYLLTSLHFSGVRFRWNLNFRLHYLPGHRERRPTFGDVGLFGFNPVPRYQIEPGAYNPTACEPRESARAEPPSA